MNRKTLTKITFTVVAAPVLAFGAPAAAMADSYFNSESSWAGPEGAASYSVTSFAGDNNYGGGSYDNDNDNDGGFYGGGSYDDNNYGGGFYGGY